MATRKEPIDIEYDEPQQEAVSDAVESNDPYESQDPADWGAAHDGTDLSHLQAQDQAACHRQRQYCQELRRPGVPDLRLQKWPVREGTPAQLRQKRHGDDLSVFFPVTKEARDALYSQILNSYEMVMEQQERQHPNQKDELKNCWRTAICPLRNLMRLPLPDGRGRPRYEYVTRSLTSRKEIP